MDSDSQTDKPPQEDFQGFANILGTFIALITLVTPIVSISLFSSPLAGEDSLLSSKFLAETVRVGE